MSVVFSVSQVGNYLKQILDDSMLNNISIVGEVGSITKSGNAIYFTLKDESSSLQCVTFNDISLDILYKGAKIIVIGTPRYYVKGGYLNINVVSAKLYGKGELYEKFLELKEKLQNEGLFERKRAIPFLVKKIGVVSSETGAVIQDIINVSTRRNDSINIVLYPVKVQGIGAVQEIVNGINYFSKEKNVDVIIVARGGGSFEDLEPFNSEEVARATFNSSIPVVSAVGHETDYSIIDFVSDLRAPTPSAAAELVTLDKEYEINRLHNIYENIKNNVIKNYSLKNQDIKSLSEQLYDREKYLLNSKQVLIFDEKDSLETNIENCLRRLNFNCNLEEQRLLGNNPKNILNKGYCKVEKNKKSVKSCKNLKINDLLTINFSDGVVESQIKKIDK
jgi:exodeoxyribonuclease VII large subunit